MDRIMLFTESSDVNFHGDCSNWYAIQTLTGSEKKLIAKIDYICSNRFKTYLPTREVIHQIKGEKQMARLPLFPGYVFVHKEIDLLLRELRNAKSKLLAKPVKANGKYLEVDVNEIRFLFKIAGKDGVIKISKGIVNENNRIEIVNGPLKNFNGQVLFINKRKNKAKARIEIMNRTVDVSLGLEIVSPLCQTEPA